MCNIYVATGSKLRPSLSRLCSDKTCVKTSDIVSLGIFMIRCSGPSVFDFYVKNVCAFIINSCQKCNVYVFQVCGLIQPLRKSQKYEKTTASKCLPFFSWNICTYCLIWYLYSLYIKFRFLQTADYFLCTSNFFLNYIPIQQICAVLWNNHVIMSGCFCVFLNIYIIDNSTIYAGIIIYDCSEYTADVTFECLRRLEDDQRFLWCFWNCLQH